MHARPMGTSPLRALVVDDYVDAREMYAEYLSFKGFEVVQAQNGLQAVAQATSLLPDFILLDLALPDIDGIEVTRRLKKAPETAAIPIIMLTANAQPRMLEEARKVGCAAVVVKPCTPEELLEIVQGFAKVRTG
ncbi:MAG: response regulator [Myxococcales bacterium]|jgi:two-component system cell cycle response regulator DivK